MAEPGLKVGLCDTMEGLLKINGAIQARHASARAILLPPGGVPNNNVFTGFK